MKKFKLDLAIALVLQLPQGETEALLDDEGTVYVRLGGGLPAMSTSTSTETPTKLMVAADRPVVDDTKPAPKAAPKAKPTGAAQGKSAATAPVAKNTAKPAAEPAPAAPAEPVDAEDPFAGEEEISLEDLEVGQSVKLHLHLNEDDTKLWLAQVVEGPAEGEEFIEGAVYVQFEEDQTILPIEETDTIYKSNWNF